MKKTLLFLLIPCIIGCARQEKASRTVKQYTIEQFYKTVNIGGGSFSFDEKKLLITSNQTGIYNAFCIPVDSGAITPLTKSAKESNFAVSWFPSDNRFMFTADQGGNEINHLFVSDTSGKAIDITPWEKAKSSFFGWSRDKKSMFIVCNKRDPKFFDMYEMDPVGFKATLFYQNKAGLDPSLLSDNKQFLVLNKSITTNNNELYLCDLKSNKNKLITEHSGDASFSPQFFSLDNQNLYYTSNEGSEFSYLMKYNLSSGKKDKVWETNWDIWYAYDSWYGKYRVIGINQDAKTVVKVFDTKTNQEIKLPTFEGSSINSVEISESEKWMRLTVGSSKFPSDIYTYNFETGKLKRLTNSINPEIDATDLVSGDVIRYKSFDGLEIPGILYMPYQATAGSKVPALVWVHGGPGGQSRLSYFSLIQYLVNHGYAIFTVNNRGSSGYGKTFFAMDDRKHGDVDLKDCVWGKKFLAQNPLIDSTKIGIIGGSYGGYMTMAALAFQPDEFALGVDLFGVTNWLRTLRSIPSFWESGKKALYAEMGDPNTADSVMLYNYSPLFHAKNIRKPFMVLQGKNDPRVLQAESDEIVAAAKQNGIKVEYVLFEDEGHGFVKNENEIRGYRQILQFLDENLKGKAANNK
jgi:dipeptidyl aminopeptidase/acylaminoacyl peptidase